MQVKNASNRGKKVFILGAGFSKEAGAPSQEDLVRKIFEIGGIYPNEYQGGIEKFRLFLANVLHIPEEYYSSIPLEDIFTPLDKCVVDGISFRDLPLEKVIEIRGLIYFLIGKTIEILLRTNWDKKTYIDKFAEKLTQLTSDRAGQSYKEYDPISVISTNWDIILDNAIQQSIDSSHPNNAVVDYCCHISSFDQYNHQVMPGLEMLGKGGFNVKLLKVHGSLNWLQCPRCQRLYVDFYNKIAIQQYLSKEKCRHCNKNFGTHDSHILTSNLIMPTFLKNLSNPQYKLIWQNAVIELSEADKIIFIGYSLPFADFEMRQLLSRMVRPNARIEVVDFGSEDDLRIKDTLQRYKVFFGSRNVTTFLAGAKQYIMTEFANH